MRIFWRFASDSGTVTTSSTADGYSADDLQRANVNPVWKSEDSLTTETITIDLGSSQQIDAFALLNHNLGDVLAISGVEIEYATDSGFTTGTGTVSGVGLTSPNWYEFFGTVSRRYWRINMTKLSSSSQIEAGRVLLGSAYVPTYATRPGFTLGSGASTTRKIRTNSGSIYSSIGVAPRVLSGTLPGLDDDDYDEITTLQETYQDGIPFVVSLNWETELARRTVYGTLTSTRPLTNVAIDKWEWQLSVREVL